MQPFVLKGEWVFFFFFFGLDVQKLFLDENLKKERTKRLMLEELK